MRILFDSRQLRYYYPFGSQHSGQTCSLHLHVPAPVSTITVHLVVEREDGTEDCRVPMILHERVENYEIYECTFALSRCGLYFYYFDLHTRGTDFPLFRQGRDTNMCAGDKWQLSIIPADFRVPAYAEGAVMYQIFPDRLSRSGVCALTGKLPPYTMHADWGETPVYLPNAQGEILNNDFFGGNLRGIQEKLPMLEEMGVEILYLNPIFMAYSNHRYDTCDYKRVDPMLGTEEDFRNLCSAAHARGMKIILDGVFSHTGSDSLYFDAQKRFGGGALEGASSKYHAWYHFTAFPSKYTCWWGIDTLPCVNKLEPSYMDYIIEDEDSVIAHWLSLGADGYRLDVVDELPESFLRALRKRLRELQPEALLIGEVWEDASNKIAYDVRRTYFTGGELDSVMNYPWRTAILNYCSGKDNGSALCEQIETIAENYPPQVLQCVMNSLSTHDTARALTELVAPFKGTRAQKAERTLTPVQRVLGLQRLRMAMALQFVLPGMPCIYFGDEAGREGYEDPFNRRCYPWGQEDPMLKGYVCALGQLRKGSPILRHGTVRTAFAEAGRLHIHRQRDGEQLTLSCNTSAEPWRIPICKLLIGSLLEAVDTAYVTIAPGGFAIWQ